MNCLQIGGGIVATRNRQFWETDGTGTRYELASIILQIQPVWYDHW